MKMTINVDYTKQVGDIIKKIFADDDRCHGNKGEHLTGIMMGFSPRIMGCLHDYRVLITTTIPITAHKLKLIEDSLEANMFEVSEPTVFITNYKYLNFKLEMGIITNSRIEEFNKFRSGVHAITLSVSMGIGCERKGIKETFEKEVKRCVVFAGPERPDCSACQHSGNCEVEET